MDGYYINTEDWSHETGILCWTTRHPVYIFFSLSGIDKSTYQNITVFGVRFMKKLLIKGLIFNKAGYEFVNRCETTKIGHCENFRILHALLIWCKSTCKRNCSWEPRLICIKAYTFLRFDTRITRVFNNYTHTDFMNLFWHLVINKDVQNEPCGYYKSIGAI